MPRVGTTGRRGESAGVLSIISTSSRTVDGRGAHEAVGRWGARRRLFIVIVRAKEPPVGLPLTHLLLCAKIFGCPRLLTSPFHFSIEPRQSQRQGCAVPLSTSASHGPKDERRATRSKHVSEKNTSGATRQQIQTNRRMFSTRSVPKRIQLSSLIRGKSSTSREGTGGRRSEGIPPNIALKHRLHHVDLLPRQTRLTTRVNRIY